MNKTEALQALIEGKTITHRYWPKPDAVKIVNNRYEYADGTSSSGSEFWGIRTEPHWELDWSIVEPIDDTPKLIINPDLSQLETQCKSYIDAVKIGESESGDYKQYIYEAAMQALYGDNIFDWINKKT